LKQPVKISIVGYTNTVPFLYGINHFFSKEEIELSSDSPADCAKKLLNEEADLGLVPVAILKKIPGYKIVSDFCIGTNGTVDSVKLYSEVPLTEIKTILLDYQSRTSVELVQILCKELWNIHPEFVSAEEGYESQVSGNTAAVIIGDRTFCLPGKYKFEFDLAEGWKELTGLPFVFAVWTSKKEMDPLFLKKFNEALAFGCANIEKSVKGLQIQCLSTSQALNYLQNRINYLLEAQKKEALARFLSFL
jgi:chorismate dehydratase